MKKRQRNTARASALQITLAIALVAISAILLASSFRAAPSNPADPNQPGLEQLAPGPAGQEETPTVIGTCDTVGPVEVESTAGTLGPIAYPTLQAAFAAINAGTHQGSISIEVCGNTTETTMADLSASGSGSASYSDITMRPVGAARIIEGSIAAAIIRLNGADNVTIDGRLGGVGNGRDLTVRNNSTATGTAAIWVASAGAGAGATNNVIRNLEIAAGATQNTSTVSTYGIIMCGNSTISTTTDGNDNDNNQFIFNRIIRARYGIVTRGAAANFNIAPIVTDNIIGPPAFGPDEIGLTGIFMQADSGALVRGNIVQFVGSCLISVAGQTCTTGADRAGIAIGTNAWASTPGTFNGDTYTVIKNIVHDIVEERTFSAVGIILGNTTGSATPTNSLVANNFVFNVRANATSPDGDVGIGISGGGNDKVVYNSIAMTGDLDPTGTTTATQNADGIRVANANSASHFGLLVKNNCVYVDVNSNTSTLLHYCIVVNSATYAFFGGSGGLDFNNYYFPPANTQMRTGGIGTTSLAVSSFLTLANWQAALTPPQDANSKQADPLYFSNIADLHVPPISPNVDMGQTVIGVDLDIDMDLRYAGAAPDIGADEQPGGSTPVPTPPGTPTPSPTQSPTPPPAPTPTPTPTPVNCISGPIAENFDNLVAPALPPGWGVNNNVDPDGIFWVTSTTTPDTGVNDAFINDASLVSDKRLDSVPYNIANAGVQLSFRNNFATEASPPSYYDGGVLEISIAGGAFNDIITAGGAFVGGGYTGTISTSFSSPLAGRMAWSGTSGGYITTIVSLPPAATGQTVVFRWRMCSDSSVASTGWRIDSFQLFCSGGAPTPTASPSPTPAPTPTPPPMGTPTPTPPCASPTTLLSQDFESGLGSWTAANTSSGGTHPELVIWTVEPNPLPLTGVGSGASTETLNSGQGANFCLADSDFAGSGVAANTTLTSPAFSAVGFTSVSLTYKLYYRHITAAAAFVEASTDGSTWTTVKTYGATTGAQVAFVYDTVDLTAYAGNATVYLRFRHTGGWYWYYAIDDILVSGCGSVTPPPVTISGRVGNCASPAPTATPPATPTPPTLPAVPNVLMTLSGSSTGTALTDATGNYSFSVASGGTYTVTPSKGPISPGSSGINTVDVLAIQRHFLLITTIPAGCRLTAADAVVNGSVNTQDVIAVQRFFLAMTSGIGSTGQYKFTPANRSYPSVASNQTGQDYAMYVVGDVAVPFVNRPTGPEPDALTDNELNRFSVERVTLPEVGSDLSRGEFTVDVNTTAIDARENLVGFQGDFTFDQRVVSFAPEPVLKTGLTAGDWTVAGNVLPGNGPIRTLRISAFSNDFAPLAGAGPLFALRIARVTGGGSTPLIWAAPPDNFIFINGDLQTQRPGLTAPGLVAPSASQR